MQGKLNIAPKKSDLKLTEIILFYKDKLKRDLHQKSTETTEGQRVEKTLNNKTSRYWATVVEK